MANPQRQGKSSQGRAGPPTPAGPPPDGRKRGLAITLLALGAGAVTIGVISGSGSGNQARTFRSVASCEAEKGSDSINCRDNFTQALNSHERNAPSFASQESCEKDHGSGNCVRPSTSSGRASQYIPAMAAFMIGQRAGGGFQAAPLYRRPGDPEGEFRQSAAFPFATSSGSSSSSSRSWTSGSGFSSSSTSTGSGTTTQRSSTSTSSGVTSVSRGGFGASSRGSSSS